MEKSCKEKGIKGVNMEAVGKEELSTASHHARTLVRAPGQRSYGSRNIIDQLPANISSPINTPMVSFPVNGCRKDCNSN